MPTAANAINNSIDLLGWPHTIVSGGRRKNSSRYTSWRNEVEVRIRAKGWQWKKDRGNDCAAFQMECVGLDDFPASGAAVIRRDLQTDDTKPTHKALNELMLDCFKKVRESHGKRKRAAAREELAAGAGQVEDKEGADAEERAPSKRGRFEDRHPVVIYILDPEDALGVLYEASLNALHVKVSFQLPDGRKTTHIRSDDELDAFLRLTEARPIKLLIVLYRDPAVRANSPPPAVYNASTYYFNLDRFDGPEYYMDEIEDSEEEVARRIGGRRGFYEGTINLRKVVQFRAVVADYITDLAARAAANTEAGRGLTNRQLVRRADYYKRRHEEKGIHSGRREGNWD
ncbi:hypothetical protein BGX38DRAFT_1279386 [Terfezia claveryi]|nr:hypothetical protein BGX38DRAFT_1279386 [Terfezia claveryi]